MERIFLLLVMMVLMAGCAPQRVTLSTEFDPAQTKKMLEQGSGSIKGSALIRQNAGGVVTCAGEEVALIPATEYSRERVQAIYGSDNGGYKPIFGSRNVVFENDNQAYQSYMRKTHCDAQGFFRFDNVAKGDFYIGTRVAWLVQSIPNGGHLSQRVSLGEGETKTIVMSPR